MVDFQERDTRRGVGDTTDRIGGSGGGDADRDGSTEDGSGQDGAAGDGADGDGRDSPEEHGLHDDHEHGDEHGHDHGDEHGHEHGDHHAHDVDTLGVGVVTISSTRSIERDPSGDVAVTAFEDAGHEVVDRELVPDDYDRVQEIVDAVVGRSDVDVVVTTGGTGVTPDDVTIEAVEPLFEKELPGFGELFRRRSEGEIGTRVVATRAAGGIAEGVPVFCLPGSEAAVRLGVTEIVLPEAGHLAGLAKRDEDEE